MAITLHTVEIRILSLLLDNFILSRDRNLALINAMLKKKPDTKVVDYSTSNGVLHYLVQDTGTGRYLL